MSEQNVEIVRSMLAPFEGVDIAAVDWGAEAIREIFATTYWPDVELRTLESGTGTGLSAVYRGFDGFVEYIRGWLEPFKEYRMEHLDYIDDGDRVLVPIRATGVGAGSGARGEIELTIAYELRDGRIARMVQYDTVQDAREAATGDSGASAAGRSA